MLHAFQGVATVGTGRFMAVSRDAARATEPHTPAMSTVELEDEAPLRLLGPPALRSGGRLHPFEPERPYLLLAYLACRRDWVRRDELADWLYPGRGIDSARSNLRKVIFLARKLPGVAIEQQGDLLRWAPDSDLARFDRACDERRWADALAAHGGELLLGLDGGDWLDAERRRVQARWHEACAHRLRELEARPAEARTLAEALLRHDPLDDLALQALGRAQQALGRGDEALQALAGYAERLSAAGLEPSAAVAQLQRDLRAAAPAAPAAGRALVGRRQELALLQQRLAQPDCRVLTLLGPPGVGKSALAHAAAGALGGTWVALEDLDDAERVPGRIAQALALTLDARRPPWDALAQALATRPVLLVLDNPDSLALGADLQLLLDGAPGVRVLAASRAPLGVAGEWRQALDGLPLPDADETDAEVLRANDAVRLFELRARPLAPGFDLAAEAVDVVRLVHEVEGLPLAIELLAAWRRLMPVREILAELAASLDVLEPSAPHERSVRASFGRAWEQLGATERRVLAQLALLPGPVDRELVRQVLQAPLPALATLVDRSLLRAEGDGRFALHPLIRRCAEPLATDADAVRERHARHAASVYARSAEAVAAEPVHVRAAWHWALARGDAALLAAMAPHYGQHLLTRAANREADAESSAALQLLVPRVPAEGALPAVGPERDAALALARVRLMRAHSLYAQGRLDLVPAEAEAALALAERLDDARIASKAQVRLGAVHWQLGRYEDAERCFLRARELAQQDGPAAALDMAGWLALVAKAQGRFDEAAQHHETLLREHRASGQLPRHMYLMNNHGNLLRLLGRRDASLALLHEARELARRHQLWSEEPFLLTNLALTHETFGEADAALDWAERAVASAGEHGEPMIEAAARLARARLRAQLRRGGAPMDDVLASLAIAGRLQSVPLRTQCLGSGGVVLAHGGRLADGLAIMLWASAQPEYTLSERQDLQRQVDRLAPSPAQLAAARAALPAATPADDVQPWLRNPSH